jgi:hypothetical protein
MPIEQGRTAHLSENGMSITITASLKPDDPAQLRFGLPHDEFGICAGFYSPLDERGTDWNAVHFCSSASNLSVTSVAFSWLGGIHFPVGQGHVHREARIGAERSAAVNVLTTLVPNARIARDCASNCLISPNAFGKIEPHLSNFGWLSLGPFPTADRLPLGNSASPLLGCRRSETNRNHGGVFLPPPFP